jgi:hypothetical protein
MRFWHAFVVVCTFCIAALTVNVVAATPQTVVALLPMTGLHAKAGQEIRKGLSQTLKHARLVVIDRNHFDSLESAWQAVLQESPSLVVGPLIQADVQWLSKQSLIPFPVITLNQVETSHPQLWQLSVSPEMLAYQMTNVLEDQGVERVLLLLHPSLQTDRLWKAFVEKSSIEIVDAITFDGLKHIPNATEALLHSYSGRQRIAHIKRILPELTVAYPWLRQDADAVLVVSPLAEALDVSYLVDYLWGQDLGLYWLDSGQASVAEFVSSTVNWGRMRTILPGYLVSAMQRETNDSADMNFFRALGKDAGRLSMFRLTASKGVFPQEGIQGDMGNFTIDVQQRIVVTLKNVWLGDGLVEIIE